ncbi:Hpt domain-containing protein [Cupriavidus metallidurans]|uniref:Hpt domain-containing protein n=1 Tax=Cupriavidus TaxID=106589 RepID=UPI001F16F375|nr:MULTISPECIES: Hpt domain-containing protein [Cupriavidus]
MASTDAADVVVVRWPLSAASQASLSNHSPPCLRLLMCDAGSIPAELPQSIDAVLPLRADTVTIAETFAGLGFVPFSAADAARLWPALDALTGGDADIRTELVQSLVLTNTEDLAALLAACDARDWDQARAMAHRIKGTARMLDCHATVAVCQAIESASIRQDGDTVTALVPLLTQAIQRLLAALATVPD